MKEKTLEEDFAIDSPLERPESDCLDRAIFAERIFKIIEGTPKASNLTIGIFGSWGSGKTTAMNFLKFYCRESGHPVASYNPWQFHNREDAWKGLVSSIDKGIALWQGKKLPTFRRQKIVKDVSETFLDVAALTEVGKIAGTLILKPLEGLLEQTKERVQKELSKALKDKRLFVFIDDLDRAEPDILYDHLMLLNEVVDLNRCIYIIGLAVDTASHAIQKKIGLPNQTDGRDFIDKIVGWQFNLPRPTDLDWHELLDSEVEKLDKHLNKDALKSIFHYIPKNPRKFKHFLRYLSALHQSFLDRFDIKELNWKLLYVAQLMRIEFPDIFEKMVSNNKVLEDISAGVLIGEATRRAGVKREDDVPTWLANIEEFCVDLRTDNKHRFHDLYKGLRESGGFLSEEQALNHLLVVEVPELFTWKEYRKFKDELLSYDHDRALKKLKEFMRKETKSKEIERMREFIKMIIRDRHTLLSHAADAIEESEMKFLIHAADNVTTICFLLLDVTAIFDGYNPIFNADVFKEWYGNFVSWAHFRHPSALYSAIRQREAELAVKLANKVSSQASLIFETIRFDDPFGDKKDFEPTQHKVVETLEKSLTEQIIDRFNRIDGIKELYGQEGRSFRHEKYLLFRINPIFHNEAEYANLSYIATQAPKDANIQKNFYEFINMLFYAATDHLNGTDSAEVVSLLHKKEFMAIVWGAATSRRMNLRAVGSLEGKRKKVINILKDENALPIPKWWDEILTEIEERRTAEPKDEESA